MKNGIFVILVIVIVLVAVYFMLKPKTSLAPVSEIELSPIASSSQGV